MDLATIRTKLARLAEADPRRERFGAATHGYRPGTPMTAARLDEIEAETGARFPDDHRAFLLDLGVGGAGPGYGILPLDHPSQIEPLKTPSTLSEPLLHGAGDRAFHFDKARLDGAVVLADHGCGYASVLVVHPGPSSRRGVWLDVRGASVGLVPTHASFGEWFEGWLDGALHVPDLTRSPALSSRCALPGALSSYLASVEKKAAVGEGELTEAQVREALSAIGEGERGLVVRADDDVGRCFDPGDAVRLCLACDAMFRRLVAREMMRPAQVLIGGPPKQGRAVV